MKLRVKRTFKFMIDNVNADKILPGTYNVPEEVAEHTALLAIQFGAAVWVHKKAPAKVAPENKAVKVPANKKKGK
jgi:hypothetical protein